VPIGSMPNFAFVNDIAQFYWTVNVCNGDLSLVYEVLV
jgi:hypothetical protein